MDKWEMYMEIQQLLKKGFSKTKVADKLGVSRATVYRHLKRSPTEMAEWVESLQTRKKKLDPYKELILNWLRERYKEFEVGESTVRAYVRELRVEYKIAKNLHQGIMKQFLIHQWGNRSKLTLGTPSKKDLIIKK
ncbi:helix-turn-helix domain-containing protein [Rossellomorea aquimaris]|uniref:helix-turn-helix domain-containing protein n=1 Tax=Rossellomorea TaxID=2837508 RepID=UPI0021CCE52A|nr:helix-turn-helix domain-containing protein [Rossellomorea aquimaris]